MSKKIVCTVTNDLSYDQRMIRICTSLSQAGYDVTLVGRLQKNSIPLDARPFAQKRMRLFFSKGKLFYLEYNVRLFLLLLVRPMDVVCAIDLDSILACYLASLIRRRPRVYDAHELFCEMQEVVSRPAVYRIWKAVEKICVPAFRAGYTVNTMIAQEFEKMYGVRYEVIRNIPRWEGIPADRSEPVTGIADLSHPQAGLKSSVAGPVTGTEWPVPEGERFIIYQGGVNEGRCFETLIPAMTLVHAKLLICGEGNFMTRARELVSENGLDDKVIFLGRVKPAELRKLTRKAWCGLTLFESTGMSNYYSLANRFFDYIHAGIPQLAMNYPAYREINNIYAIAVLVDKPGVPDISEGLNVLLNNMDLYRTLQGNCEQAGKHFSWQEEEKKLIPIYQKILGG